MMSVPLNPDNLTQEGRRSAGVHTPGSVGSTPTPATNPETVFPLDEAQAALESLANQLKANGELMDKDSDEEAEFLEMEGKALCALGWIVVAKEVSVPLNPEGLPGALQEEVQA